MAIGCQRVAVLGFIVLGLIFSEGVSIKKGVAMEKKSAVGLVRLPRPVLDGGMTLEQALLNRRSRRGFTDRSLNLEQLSRLVWAAQGVTSAGGSRTAPSAGALYPLEVYVVSGRTEGLVPGIYHYEPGNHQLRLIREGDHRSDLCRAALSQQFIAVAAVALVITAVPSRTTVKYGERGMLYILMEVGHAGQNILLEAESLGLGAVPIGAFAEREVQRLMQLDSGERPLYIIPVGHTRQAD